VCSVCEGADLELPMDGFGTHWNLGNSSINGGALAIVHKKEEQRSVVRFLFSETL